MGNARHYRPMQPEQPMDSFVTPDIIKTVQVRHVTLAEQMQHPMPVQPVALVMMHHTLGPQPAAAVNAQWITPNWPLTAKQTAANTGPTILAMMSQQTQHNQVMEQISAAMQTTINLERLV